MSDTLNAYRERYAALCAKRDAKLAEVADLVAQKEAANTESEVAKNKAVALAQEISDLKGGQGWIDLKKEIGFLAKALSGK